MILHTHLNLLLNDHIHQDILSRLCNENQNFHQSNNNWCNLDNNYKYHFFLWEKYYLYYMLNNYDYEYLLQCYMFHKNNNKDERIHFLDNNYLIHGNIQKFRNFCLNIIYNDRYYIEYIYHLLYFLLYK